MQQDRSLSRGGAYGQLGTYLRHSTEVTRTGYGAEGKPSLHPLDGALNLPAEKYSLEVRRRVAIEAAKGAFEEGVKALEVFTGAPVPKRQFKNW